MALDEHNLWSALLAIAAYNLYGTRVLDLVKYVELLARLELEDETYARSQQKCCEHARWFEKYRPTLVHIDYLVYSYDNREEEDHEKHDDDRIFELLEILLPQRLFLGWWDYV